MIGEALELAALVARRRWSRARLEALRRRKLRRLVEHAYRNVPYYRALMDRARVKPGEIQNEEDLHRLPITRKEDLRRAGEACLAKGAGPLMSLYTSGFSGKPFEVKLTPAEYRRRRLREFRMLLGMGLRPRDHLVLLGPLRPRPARLHRLLGFYRLTVIPLTLPVEEQIARFRATRADVLWFYPATLRSMLSVDRELLRRTAPPRFLISSSAVMDPVLRARLERDLPGVPILEAYAANESGRIAAECPLRQGLHLEDDAVIVELLENGEPAPPGAAGSVVLTCLDQLAMPFIRYELGDLARFKNGVCRCGWQTRLIDRPLGRLEEMLRLRDGRLIDSSVINVVLREWPSVWQHRFIQRRYDLVEGQLVYETPPRRDELERLRCVLEEKVGCGMRFELRVLDRIDDEGLKFHAFLCRIEEDNRDLTIDCG